MWCFCRKRSSIIEDEQSEEFVRIVCDKSNNINDERTQLSNSIEKRRYNNQDESLANQNEFNAIYEGNRGKGKDYENSEICAKFISEVGNPNEVALLEKSSNSNLVPEVSMKLHKAEVHSSGKKENKLSINDGKESNKNKCNDSTKIQNATEGIETSFSNHFTQTENGVLPVPLMKRREKTKSTEMTDNPYSARNSNTPLDLSHKSVINSDGNPEKIFSKYKEQKDHQNKASYHYENLPPGSENVTFSTEISQKGPMLPLDLSLGSVGKCQDRSPGDSKLVDLHLELYPLNLSKKNLLSAEMAVSPPSFGRNYNSELSPMSVETSNTQCFSTASSRPDLLSNVDNDDYNFNDNSKISFFNGVYDKSSSSNVNLHAAHSGNCIGNDGNRIMSPSSLHNIKHYGSGSRDATKPQMAHSGSYVHPNIPSHHWQPQAKPLSFDRCNIPSSHQYLGSNNCLAHVRLPHNVVPCPNQAHLKAVISCSNSIHSLSNHSMNNSYYNPSYQNHTLDEEASYAVLDDVRKKPLYDNLESSEGNLYDIYDDKTKINNGPVYANMSPKAENLYFAYDNNTYIPPQRLKKIENTYENEGTAQIDHTYSTISKSTHIASSESSHNNTVPAKATSPDIFFEVPEQNKTKISSNQSCSKPQMLCSESVPVALNLVKVPEIPLPVKVKSSSGGRNFLKHSKNTNNNGRNGKLTNSASKSGSKFGNKFKGKIKDITLVEASSSIMDELLSPSTPKQIPEDKQKKKKQSLTSLTSHQEATPEKMGPSLGACGKKFSSLSDMKKNSTSPISASNTPKPKGNRSGRSLLSSFSFRGDKKQSTSKKSDGSRLNKWSNSSAASLGSIASLASSSSSISNYIHPPSIASEGALLSNYKDEYDCGEFHIICF